LNHIHFIRTLSKNAEEWAKYKDYKNNKPIKYNRFASGNQVSVIGTNEREKKKEKREKEIEDKKKDFNDYTSYLILMKKNNPQPQAKPTTYALPTDGSAMIERKTNLPEIGQTISTDKSFLYIDSKMGNGAYGSVFKVIKIKKTHESGVLKTPEQVKSEIDKIKYNTNVHDEHYFIIKVPNRHMHNEEAMMHKREDLVLKYLNQDPSSQEFIVKYMGKETRIDDDMQYSFYEYKYNYITLTEYFKNTTTLPDEHIFYKIFLCMKYLQEKGIVHADIKPDNIMVSNNPNNDVNILFLIDFGCSCKIDNKEKISSEFKDIFCGKEYLGGTPYFRDVRIDICLVKSSKQNKSNCYTNEKIIPGIDYFALGIMMHKRYYKKKPKDILTLFAETPFFTEDDVIRSIIGSIHRPISIIELKIYYELYSGNDQTLSKIYLQQATEIRRFQESKTTEREKKIKQQYTLEEFIEHVELWKSELQKFFNFIDAQMLEYYKKNEISVEKQMPKMEEFFKNYDVEEQTQNNTTNLGSGGGGGGEQTTNNTTNLGSGGGDKEVINLESTKGGKRRQTTKRRKNNKKITKKRKQNRRNTKRRKYPHY